MANSFFRKAIIGADDNNWAIYNDAFNLNAIGDYSCYLFNDSGILKISKGRVGINNGSVVGVSDIDTITTVSIAGITNSTWAKIEMSVSGSAVTFSSLDISSENDPASFPSVMATAYNGEKQGYYIDSTKRVIGLIWKNSSGVLDGIVNVRGADEGYIGYSVDTSESPDLTYRWDKEKAFDKSGVPWGNPFMTAIRKKKTGNIIGYFESSAGTITQDDMYQLLSPYIEDGITTLSNGVIIVDVFPGEYNTMLAISRSGSTITLHIRRESVAIIISINCTSGNATDVIDSYKIFVE